MIQAENGNRPDSIGAGRHRNWKIKDLGSALRLVLHFGIPLGALFLIAIGQAIADLPGLLFMVGVVGIIIYFTYRRASQSAREHLAGVKTQIIEVTPDSNEYVVKCDGREIARIGETEGTVNGKTATVTQDACRIEIEGTDEGMPVKAIEASRAPGSREWKLISPERHIQLKPANWYFDSIWSGRSHGRPVCLSEPESTIKSLKGYTASQVTEDLNPAEKVIIGIVANRVHRDPTTP